MSTVTQKVTLTGAVETDAHIRRIHPATHITCQAGGTERAHLWVTITCGTVTLPSLPLCVPCAELIGEAIIGAPVDIP